MKLWTTILVCLSVFALGLTACDKKKDGEDAAKAGGATSAADVCKKIGDGDKDCEAALGMLEKTLDEKLWGEFASCAIKAGNMEGSEKCMTKDMMAKLSGGAAVEPKVEPKPVEPKPAGDVLTYATAAEALTDLNSVEGMDFMDKFGKKKLKFSGKIKSTIEEMDGSFKLMMDHGGEKGHFSLGFTDKGAAAKEKGIAKDAEVTVLCKFGGKMNETMLMFLDCELQ